MLKRELFITVLRLLRDAAEDAAEAVNEELGRCRLRSGRV